MIIGLLQADQVIIGLLKADQVIIGLLKADQVIIGLLKADQVIIGLVIFALVILGLLIFGLRSPLFGSAIPVLRVERQRLSWVQVTPRLTTPRVDAAKHR